MNKREKYARDFLIKAFAAICITLVGAGFSVPAEAHTPNAIPIDTVHFPDDAFRRYVANGSICADSVTEDCRLIDGNQDGVLSQTELSQVTHIAVANSGIRSLQGIEYFEELTSLIASGNELTDIDLSRNSDLFLLTVDHNSLVSLDISANKKLTALYATQNLLSFIDLRKNAALENGMIDLRNNALLGIETTEKQKPILGGSTEGQCYESNNSFLDITEVAPNLDTSKISNIKNGSLQGNTLTPIDYAHEVSYQYSYGSGQLLHTTVRFRQPSVSFVDVSALTPHVDDIRWLADRGISTGWKEADGSSTFRGMSPVVRQDMAAFLRREAKNRGVGDAASWRPSAADWKRFRDVDKSTPHAEDILWLAHAGISTGWKEADGTSTFRGMSPVVRQDMAAFLKRLAARAGKDGGVKPKTDFTDVTAATPHMADVQWLGGSGISQGYRNNDGSWRFEGMTRVYRQDMAAFIHRLDNQLNK